MESVEPPSPPKPPQPSPIRVGSPKTNQMQQPSQEMSNNPTISHVIGLCRELWSLRVNGSFCDVVFNIKGEVLGAHSVIVSASSPVLKRLCLEKSNPSGHDPLVINLDTYSFKIVRNTLEFMYTGKYSFDEENVNEFQELAKEWKLLDLHNIKNSSISDDVAVTGEYFSEILAHFQLCLPVKDEINADASKSVPQSAKQSTNELKTEKNTRKRKVTVAEPKIPENTSEDGNDSPMFSDSDTEEDQPDIPDASFSSKEPTKSSPKKKNKQMKRKDKVKRKSGCRIGMKYKTKGKTCHLCGEKLANSEEMYRHRKDVHKMIRPEKPGLRCDLCEIEFKEHNGLRQHRYENHWEPGMEAPIIYKCDQENCEYTSTSQNAIRVHKIRHQEDPRICELCGKVLKNKIHLSTHMATHKDLPDPYCSFCDRKFSDATYLKKHISQMHLGKPSLLFCTKCTYQCKSNNILTEHMYQMHNEDVPESSLLTCSICDFKTTIKQKLNAHYRTHNLGQRYECDECGKSYTVKQALAHHKRIHNNTAKTYKCNYCDYSTVYGTSSLKQHVRCMHKDQDVKPWKCEQCPYSTMTEDILNRHLTIKHGKPLQVKPKDPVPPENTGHKFSPRQYKYKSKQLAAPKSPKTEHATTTAEITQQQQLHEPQQQPGGSTTPHPHHQTMTNPNPESFAWSTNPAFPPSQIPPSYQTPSMPPFIYPYITEYQ